MTRKRFRKLLMGACFPRNRAEAVANFLPPGVGYEEVVDCFLHGSPSAIMCGVGRMLSGWFQKGFEDALIRGFDSDSVSVGLVEGTALSAASLVILGGDEPDG